MDSAEFIRKMEKRKKKTLMVWHHVFLSRMAGRISKSIRLSARIYLKSVQKINSTLQLSGSPAVTLGLVNPLNFMAKEMSILLVHDGGRYFHSQLPRRFS